MQSLGNSAHPNSQAHGDLYTGGSRAGLRLRSEVLWAEDTLPLVPEHEVRLHRGPHSSEPHHVRAGLLGGDLRRGGPGHLRQERKPVIGGHKDGGRAVDGGWAPPGASGGGGQGPRRQVDGAGVRGRRSLTHNSDDFHQPLCLTQLLRGPHGGHHRPPSSDSGLQRGPGGSHHMAGPLPRQGREG